ncbi:PLAC8 family-domain-containing protein [Russula aff. rugulosa BPL654]|nr:PLAC8 family-domain-containing protein [Russula aff. rugulosa BPL654]
MRLRYSLFLRHPSHPSQPWPNTVLVGGNRNAKNRPIGSNGKRDWSHGICSCFGSCGTCCMSCWCPCIVFGKNKQRLRNLNTHGTPLPGGGSACDGDCCLYCGLGFCGLGWVLQIGSRGEVRDRYSIDGGACSDCCCSFWCGPCALTQERREIESEEYSF